jgi:hypothetical protein
MFVMLFISNQEKWDQPNRIWDDLGSANGPRISRLIKDISQSDLAGSKLGYPLVN